MLAEEDKRKERCEITFEADSADEPTHGDSIRCAVRPVVCSKPTKMGFMCNGVSSLEQVRNIYVKILSAVKVTQRTDTAEQVADEVFKAEVTRPASSDLDTGWCEKFEFDPIQGVGIVMLYNIIWTKDCPSTSQHLRLRRVNYLRRVIFARRETFDAIKAAPSAFTSESDTSFTYLVESKHHPGHKVDRRTDKDQIADKRIARRVFKFPSARRFKDKGVRRKRLTAEERAILRHRRFKALGINALLRELARCLARICIANASDLAEGVSESAAEDIAFVLREFQRFLDSISEAIVGKAEVLEHGTE